MDDGRCRIGGSVAELDAAEVEGIGKEAGASGELEFTTKLALNLSLFHLRGSLELFAFGLGREALLIGAFDGIVDVEEVFRHEEHVVRHEREERHLLVGRHREFWHDLNLVALFTRELVLHLKRADGVDIVAKEVDTIRKFAAEGVDVEDGATQRKLSWLVDVVHLVEAKLAKRLLYIRNGNRLILGKDEGAGVEVLLENDELCDCLRIGDDI